MEIKALHCRLCGGALRQIGAALYQCENNPSHQFKEKSICEQREHLLALFGEALCGQNEERIANLRCNLWESAHEKYIDSTKIIGYCRELKKLVPDDFQANFYEIANSRAAAQINRFLDKIDVEKSRPYLGDIIDFMIKSLESKNVSSLKNLIERAYKDQEYTDLMTIVETEAEKLSKGIYEPTLPRDVFLAYSSADMDKVNELTDYLESQKLSCFVALRNLRHGRGAVENYEAHLKKAMHNCKCIVFVSSENSRDLDCDALTVELSHVKEHEPQLGRIEYLIQSYQNTSDAAKILLEDFFRGLEYCRTKEDLLRRILKYKTASNKGETAKNVKFCLACGEENPARAKLCFECGGMEFVSTHKEYLDYKAEEMKKAAEEKLEKEREAIRKAQEEELARKKSEMEEEIRKQLEAEYSAKYSQSAVQPQTDKVDDDYPTLENYDKAEFEIENGVLIEYKLKDKKGEVEIPYGVKTVGDSAFKNCKDLLNIIIPNSITSIGESAFFGCWALTNITIPNSVMSIGEGAFEICLSLKSITVLAENGNYCDNEGVLFNKDKTKLICYPMGKKISSYAIPNSVTSIGGSAFAYCDSLTNITIPNSVTSIDEGAFFGCSSLKSITVSAGNGNYCDKDGVLFNKSKTALICYPAGKEISSFAIPNSVTSICNSAFSWCSSLANITIPNSVTKIDGYAFISCSSLTNITIPNSVTSIGESAFKDCSLLENITIPNSVTSIGESAFKDCSSLKNVVIPARWKSIIDNAFGEEKTHIKFEFYEKKQENGSGDTQLIKADKNEAGSKKIKVFGVGGAGNNAVNRLIEAHINCAELYVVNTDSQILSISPCENKIQIGKQLTKGLPAGGKPDVGMAAAKESKKELMEALKGTDLLFIAAGMGGGTGTGATPVIAEIAREMGILTIAVVTEPFAFEGKKRIENKVWGLENLKKYVDTLIVIPNDKISLIAPKNTSMKDVFRISDEILKQGITELTELIVNSAFINLNFADVKTILKDGGIAHFGVGVAKGENRTIQALRYAANYPLLETTIVGAQGVILMVTGGNDLTFAEIEDAAELVRDVIDKSANFIFGSRIDPKFQEGEVEITIIATGLKE